MGQDSWWYLGAGGLAMDRASVGVDADIEDDRTPLLVRVLCISPFPTARI